MTESAVLLLTCRDRPGIVLAVSEFLFTHNANILHADQHQDNVAGLFFMRVEFALANFTLDRNSFEAAFAPIAADFGMDWRLAFTRDSLPVAIFVSHYQHCLADLLYRHHAHEIHGDIRLVVSNHPDAAALAEFYRVPFFHVSGAKSAMEQRHLELLDANGIELIVLARYMQILSPEFVARYPDRIINVHHSFLPAFTGAKPYHAAFDRGVKLIGATSHYVTSDLDEGPIIEQDVARVSHRDQVEDLIERGRDLERLVLSRAVKWHLDNRILCYGNKTVVFD